VDAESELDYDLNPELGHLYRSACGHTEMRLLRHRRPSMLHYLPSRVETPNDVRRDPARGLKWDAGLLSRPEVQAVIAEAVADVLAGKPPRW